MIMAVFVLSMCYLISGAMQVSSSPHDRSTQYMHVSSAKDGTTELQSTEVTKEHNILSSLRVDIHHASGPTLPGTAAPREGSPEVGTKRREVRFLGINSGNLNTNFQAGMWLLGLVGVLAAALPVVFLDSSLAYKRKRSAFEDGATTDEGLMGEQLSHAVKDIHTLHVYNE